MKIELIEKTESIEKIVMTIPGNPPIVKIEKKNIGYISCFLEAKRAEIKALYVQTEERKKGYGSLLLMEMLTYLTKKKKIDRITAFVQPFSLVSNDLPNRLSRDQLESFYEKHGFVYMEAEGLYIFENNKT